MQKYIASAEREQCIFTKFQQASAKRSPAGILSVERARSASLCTNENKLMHEREARVFAQRGMQGVLESRDLFIITTA
jgi:hypothetical protein